MAIVTFNNTNPSVCNLTVTLNANPAQPITVNGVTFPFNFNPETYGFGPNDTDGLYTFNCADCRYDHIVEGGNITTTTTSSTTSTTTDAPTTSSTTTVEETTSTTTEDPIVDIELRWLINEGGIDTLQLIDEGNVYSPLRTENFTYNNSGLGTVFKTVQVGALNGFEFTGLSGELTYKINEDPIVSGGSNVQHNISGFSANYSPSNEVWFLNLAITAQQPYGELVDGEVFTLEIFGDAITTTTTTEFVPPEFLCGDASPIIATGEVGQEVVLSQPLSEGVLEGIEPQYYVEGDQTYTVEIKIPAGYQDVGQSIFCDVNAIGFTTTTSSTTLPTLLCENVNIQIGGGLEGTPVIDTVTTDIGSVDSVTPENFVEGTNDYMVTILVPQGYDNDTLVCEVSGVGTTTTTTLPTLECKDIVISIPNGDVGDTITASATLDGVNLTIQQIEISGSVVTEYLAGFVPYDVVIVVPNGFNNTTLTCSLTAFGATPTTTSTTTEEITTTTTLPEFNCDIVTVKFGGTNPTDGEEIPYGEFTIVVTGYSGDPIVITDIQPENYDVNQSVYQVTFIIPEGYQGAGTEFTCDSMEITVDPTTTTTTTIEETTTTTTTESVQSYVVRACCDTHEGNPTIHGFVELPTTYTGGEQVSIDGVCYTIVMPGGSNPHVPTTVVDYIDCDDCTSSPSTVNCVVETTSTTTEEETTTTTTEGVVYETYEITPCCDNTDPTAIIHQYVELPNTYIVSDVLSINNVCYTITKVSTGPNPLTPTNIVDYETCDDCVQDDNNFGCVYTYEACAETLHGHGNLMVNPDKINIIDNQIYGETVEDKEYGFMFTNSGGQTFITTDCYNHITYDPGVDVVDAIPNGNVVCSDNNKCAYFNMYVEHCDTGKSSTVQISMLAANNLGLVNGDVVSSPALAAAASAYGGGSGTCYTVGGKTNTVNSSQDTQQTGTDWSLTTKKTTEVESCFDDGCGCKKNFTVTNTSNDTFILRYKTCSGEFFDPLMGPFESITFDDDDCVNMNTIWYYSTIQDTQNGYGVYYNKIEISGTYEDCVSAERNVSTTTTEKDNQVTTTTTIIGDTTSTTTEEVTSTTTTENITTSTTTENVTTSTTIEPPVSTTTTTEQITTSTTTEIPCLIYELSNRNREGGDTMTAYFTDCDGKQQEAIVLADSEGTICALRDSVSFPGVVTESTVCDPSQTTTTTTTVNTDTTTSTTTNGSGGGSGSSSDEYDGNLTTSTTSGPKGGGGNLTTSTTDSNNDGDITTSTTIDLIIIDPTETSTTTMDTGDGSGNGGGQVTSTTTTDTGGGSGNGGGQLTSTTTNGSGGGSVGSRESVYEFERCDDNSVVRILTSQWIGLPPLSGSYFKLDVGQGEECMEYGFTTVSSDFDTLTSVSGPYDSCMSCQGITTSTTTIQQIITSTTTEEVTTSTTTIQQIITSTTTEEVTTSTTTEDVTSTTTELPCYYYELGNRNPQGSETMIGTYYDCDGKLQDVYVLGDSEGTVCALQGTVSFSGDIYEVGLCGSIPETTSTTVIEEPITTSTTEEPVLGGGSGSK